MIDGPLTPIRRKFAGVAALFAVLVLVGIGLSVAQLRLRAYPARVTEVDAHGFAHIEATVNGSPVRLFATGLQSRGLRAGDAITVRCDTSDREPACRAPGNAALWGVMVGLFLAAAALSAGLYAPEIRERLALRRPALGGGAYARPPGGDQGTTRGP